MISNVICSLPFPSDTKKLLFDLTFGMLNGTIGVDSAIEQFSKVNFVLENTKQSSFSIVFNEAQNKLNELLDNLWNIVDSENMTNLNDIVTSIRHLFNSLFYLINEQQKQVSKLTEDIGKLHEEVATLKISEGELLLGSLATQLIIKCAHYLEIDEPIHITKFRTGNMLNTQENIGLLKEFLRRNGFDWNHLLIIIQMLKCRRLLAAHPSNPNTTMKDIQTAIDQVYPDVNSKDREKAKIGLAILETLAKELGESLFMSTES